MASHEYQTLQVPLENLTNPSTNPNAVTRTRSNPTIEVYKWRPSYLRRRVLYGFMFVFALIIVGLETILAISNKADGIATGYYQMHYLWTYGPTALLTVIAALFSRVEYQSKLVTPWQRLAEGPVPAEKALLLDYVSQLPPWAIYTSLRNKDFTVAATTTVSLITQLLIVLSNGLIVLLPTQISEHSIQVQLQDAFVDNSTVLQQANTLPYYIMQASIAGGLSYPPGLSRDFAFQSVQTDVQIQVTVDGLTNSLACELANLTVTSTQVSAVARTESTSNLHVTVASPGCSINVTIAGPAAATSHKQGSTILIGNSSLVGRFTQGQCDGTSDDAGRRILVLFGNLTGLTLVSSTQLLCSPTYTITEVNLVQNGTDIQSVTPSPSSENRTLDHVSPWDIMQSHFNSYNNEIAALVSTAFQPTQMYGTGETKVDVDIYSMFLYGSQNVDISRLDDPEYLQEVTTKYYRQSGAVVARTALMEPASIDTFGSATINENRLFVQAWAVQWMVGLAAASLALVLLITFMIPTSGVLPCSPCTFPGMAALITYSHELLARLQYSGDADEEALHHLLESTNIQSGTSQEPGSSQPHGFVLNTTRKISKEASWSFKQSVSKHSHPWALRFATRLTLSVTLLAIVITLEVALRKSNKEDGLGNVEDGKYIHYLWTSLPGLVFGLLALTLSSVDSTTRTLLPYIMLKNTLKTEIFFALDFLNVSVPRAIYREVKLRQIGALAATTSLLVASFLTTFSASLFQAMSVATTGSASLLVNSSFPHVPRGSSSACFQEGEETASMILTSNQSYPKFTYEGLAFPQMLATPDLEESTDPDPLTLRLNTVVPAIRERLDCRLYNATQINARLDENQSVDSSTMVNLLRVNISDEQCNPYLETDSAFTISTYSNTSYFGLGDSSYSAGSCSDFMFIWGQVEQSPAAKILHLAAMGCNESYEALDIATSFIGTGLAIDMQYPPQPMENTTRESTAGLGGNGKVWAYQFLVQMPTEIGHELSRFFLLLVTSRWALPVSTLGDSAKVDVVANAIKYQHSISQTQVMAACREPASTTNATLVDPPDNVQDGNDARTFNATVKDPTGRLRVVQDSVTTRILEALLSVTLVLLILGWVYLPKANALPDRSPTTIANVVALLAGGNLLEVSPDSLDWLSRENVEKSLGRDIRFWMGWGLVPDIEGQLMGNENENGISRFGLFVATQGAEKDFDSRVSEESSNMIEEARNNG